MSLTILAYLAAGLALLALGAELLVRGGARLARQVGLSPWIIGLAVAALGSSAPETAVGTLAVLDDSGDLAVGNIIGSNIANILLLIGVSALIAPQILSRHLVHQGLPLLIGSGLLVQILAWDGLLDRLDGFLLLTALVPCTVILILTKRRGQQTLSICMADKPHPEAQLRACSLSTVLITAGLLLLVGGAWITVDAAREFALDLGLSELTVGLTVLAVGTSLPEMTVSLLATLRGQHAIATGNAVGCCILNLLLVLGCTALVAPKGLSISPNIQDFDLPVMLAAFFACIPVFVAGYRISRWEGLLFFAYYLAYVLYLALFATGLPSFELFQQAMGWFVLPLTVAILASIGWRTWRQR
ncbi:calcium/sodium antiporter [Azomonas macrocytogenes]|uniref:Cation:H+ antiporter n=1 Tax=Azomonas macrocytogenes TaxID=69962 RepID=A0A839T6K7_AZOMA|nr:calcium/sodium antiporter [Azomonas macrocytogenes]MBB3104709.1 cation:H+ antiporter [Azomonas macrocytogenes]